MSEYDSGIHASRCRWEKAERMAAYAWDAGLKPDHIAAMNHARINVLARLAG